MDKRDFLPEKVELILQRIDFINRFQLISEGYGNVDDNFVFTTEEIKRIAIDIGYNLRYSRGKDFYYTEKIDQLEFTLGFMIRYNSFDFGMTAKKPGFICGGPWHFLVDLLSNNTVKFNRIMFRNYDEVRDILKKVFLIYEDFKNEMLVSYK